MQFYFAHKQLLKSFYVACWFLFMVFSANKWFAKKRQDKCLISLFRHIGIETGNRKESESIKFKRYPTLVKIVQKISFDQLHQHEVKYIGQNCNFL